MRITSNGQPTESSMAEESMMMTTFWLSNAGKAKREQKRDDERQENMCLKTIHQVGSCDVNPGFVATKLCASLLSALMHTRAMNHPSKTPPTIQRKQIRPLFMIPVWVDFCESPPSTWRLIWGGPYSLGFFKIIQKPFQVNLRPSKGLSSKKFQSLLSVQ